jgi:hypothetical protein
MNGKFWASPRVLNVRDPRTTSEKPLFQLPMQAWPLPGDFGLILQGEDPC